MKTLIIGANTNGIGEHYRQQYAPGANAPTLTELDVTDDKSRRDYLEHNGPFTHILYSAGVSKLEWTQDITAEGLQKVFAINTFGLPLLLADHLQIFPEAGGTVVAVISDAAHTPMRGSLAYCASKSALEMSVRVLARELYPLWSVRGISPGVVENTEMTRELSLEIPEFRGWSPEQAHTYEQSSSVIERRVGKDEVSMAIDLLMMADDAYNGTIITINGGK